MKEDSKMGDTILVPKKISLFTFCSELSYKSGWGDNIFIRSNNNKNLLCSSDDTYNVPVFNPLFYKKISCKLIPCNYESFISGDTAFRGDIKTSLDNITCYSKIVDNGYVFFYKNSILHSFEKDFKWYKIVPV